MPRGNGGVLGPANIPNQLVAKGVWSLNEQQLAQRQNIWPTVSDPYFEYTTLLLSGNGTNGAQNNTFLDGSTNNFTITRNGNTTQGTFSPFSQTGWGNYFSGSQSISIAATASLQYSGDFTIECWFYKNATGDATTFIQQSGSNYFAMNVNPGTGINIYLNNASANFIITDRVPQPNTWHHIALVRSGSASGNIKCYLDGVASTTTATNTSTLGYNAIGYLGAIGTASGGSFVGYISNFRIASGRAVYTSNFTPPTTPLTRTTGGTNPPQGSETIWLTAQSNRFLDSDGVNTPASSPLTITVNGSPSVQAFSPFNPLLPWSAATYGGSGYFDGSGDYLTSPNNTAVDFGSGSFTVETWFYPAVNITDSRSLFSKRANASVYAPFVVEFNASMAPIFYFSTTGSSWNQINSSVSCVVNAWNHVAITRNGSTFTIWINGVSGGTTTNASALMTNTDAVSIGAAAADGSRSINGYMSSVRMVKGTAVYTAAFTPPTAPLTAITNTSLLLNFTNAGIYDATSKNDLETVGNAQISTTQSKWGGSSMAFDGTGDYLINGSINSTFYQFETGDFTVEFWLYPTTVSVVQYLIDFRDPTIPSGAAVYLFLSASAKLAIYVGPNAVITASTTSISANTWTHIALVKNGTGSNNYKLYINGNADATTGTYTNILTFGFLTVAANSAQRNTAATDKLNGYLQDLRITKGYARYVTGTGANAGKMVFNGTNDLALPTAAFPTL